MSFDTDLLLSAMSLSTIQCTHINQELVHPNGNTSAIENLLIINTFLR